MKKIIEFSHNHRLWAKFSVFPAFAGLMYKSDVHSASTVWKKQKISSQILGSGKSLVCLMLFPLLAVAQNIPQNLDETLGILANLSTSEQVMSRVKQILAHSEKQYSPNCGTITSGQLASISVLDTPEFDAANTPRTGEWMTRYEIAVCDKQFIRSIHFEVKGEGIAMSALLPGNTQADPQLQDDVAKAFKMALARAFPTCETPYIADTRLLTLPENGAAPWEELWVADACGSVFGQAIKFAPSDEGTAFALDIPTS